MNLIKCVIEIYKGVVDMYKRKVSVYPRLQRPLEDDSELKSEMLVPEIGETGSCTLSIKVKNIGNGAAVFDKIETEQGDYRFLEGESSLSVGEAVELKIQIRKYGQQLTGWKLCISNIYGKRYGYDITWFGQVGQIKLHENNTTRLMRIGF